MIAAIELASASESPTIAFSSGLWKKGEAVIVGCQTLPVGKKKKIGDRSALEIVSTAQRAASGKAGGPLKARRAGLRAQGDRQPSRARGGTKTRCPVFSTRCVLRYCRPRCAIASGTCFGTLHREEHLIIQGSVLRKYSRFLLDRWGGNSLSANRVWGRSRPRWP